MTAQALSPCLVDECKNEGEYLIYITGKVLQKGYPLCKDHLEWLGKTHQVILKDYD